MTPLPGPRPHRLLGALGSGYACVRDPIGEMGWRFERYGPIVGMVGGAYQTPEDRFRPVFCCGPALNQSVITQHDVYHKLPLTDQLFGEPPDDDESRRGTLSRFMGGLFHVNGDVHRQHRRLLMPAFHKRAIETYHADMVRITAELLDGWQPGEAFDVHEQMRVLTMRIVVKTLFGQEMAPGEEGIGHALQEGMLLLFKPPVLLMPFDVPPFPFRRMLNKVMLVDRTIQAIIAEKRAAGAQENDLLSALIRSRDEDGTTLTEKELIGHAEVIFGAGHETSSTALTWTLLLLSQHPAVMADLYEELTGALGGAPPTIEQLAELPFLEAVIKESMRVIPPVPFNSRMVAEPTELGGYPMDVGREVFVSIYHTHHMAEHFPNPERFDPYRWETIRPGPFTYNPFSAGPRMCIGAAFAMMEIKIVLAMLLQRYRMEALPATINRDAGITMATRGPIPMKAHPQDERFREGVGGIQGDVHEMVKLP
jgi:cytochrome P450